MLSYLLIGLDCLLDLADLGHVELQQVHTDAAVSKRYFFAPAAIWELFEAKLVPVVMRLSKDKGIHLQVGVESKESSKSSI